MEDRPGHSEEFAFGIETDPVAHHPYRPTPDPLTGELKVDPEIYLKAKIYNLTISFFYSSSSGVNEEYGKKRSATPKTYVVSQLGGSNKAQIVKGDGSKFLYEEANGGNGNGGMPG